MVDDIGLVPHISLAAAANCSNGTFAVCGDEGRALWYGPFLDSDADNPHGDSFAGTMAAAARAIWLAGRARSDAGHTEATLHLVLSDSDVDTVTLACAASMSGLILDLVISEDNPALDWCQVFGSLDWNPGALVSLVDQDEPEGRLGRHLRAVHTFPYVNDEPKEAFPMIRNPGEDAGPVEDAGMELRSALEALLLHDAAGIDATMRHAISATVHLAVDTPHGRPDDAEEFLGRLDAAWLIAAWAGHDTEMSLIATLAAGEVPALSWCELMFTTALAPWSTNPAAVQARRIFSAVPQGRLGAVPPQPAHVFGA